MWPRCSWHGRWFPGVISTGKSHGMGPALSWVGAMLSRAPFILHWQREAKDSRCGAFAAFPPWVASSHLLHLPPSPDNPGLCPSPERSGTPLFPLATASAWCGTRPRRTWERTRQLQCNTPACSFSLGGWVPEREAQHCGRQLAHRRKCKHAQTQSYTACRQKGGVKRAGPTSVSSAQDWEPVCCDFSTAQKVVCPQPGQPLSTALSFLGSPWVLLQLRISPRDSGR